MPPKMPKRGKYHVLVSIYRGAVFIKRYRQNLDYRYAFEYLERFMRPGYRIEIKRLDNPNKNHQFNIVIKQGRRGVIREFIDIETRPHRQIQINGYWFHLQDDYTASDPVSDRLIVWNGQEWEFRDFPDKVKP